MDEDGSDIGTLLTGAGTIFTGAFVAKSLGFVGQALVIRALSPEIFGRLSLAFTVTSVVGALFLLGIPEGVARLASAEKKKSNEYIAGGLLVSLSAGAVGSTLIYFFRYEVAELMNEPALIGLIGFFSVYVLFTPIASTIVGSLRGLELHRSVNIADHLAPKVILIAVFILASLLSAEVAGAIIYLGGSPVLVTLIGGYLLIRRGSVTWPATQEFRSRIQRLASFSWPLAFQGGFVLLMSNADVLLIGYFMKATSVGLYRATQPLASLPFLLLTSVVFVYLPIATRQYTQDRHTELEELFITSAKWVLNLSLPVILVLVFLPREVLTLIYGTSYAPAAVVLSLLAINTLLRIAAGPNGAMIKAIDRTRIDLVGSVIGVMVNIVLNVLLIPRYGLLGAAIATTLGYTAFNTVELVIIYQELGIFPFSRATFIPLLGTVPVFALVGLATDSFVQGEIRFILAVPTAFVIHAVSVYSLNGLQKEDLLLIDAVEERIGQTPVTIGLRRVVENRVE